MEDSKVDDVIADVLWVIDGLISSIAANPVFGSHPDSDLDSDDNPNAEAPCSSVPQKKQPQSKPPQPKSSRKKQSRKKQLQKKQSQTKERKLVKIGPPKTRAKCTSS